MPHGGPDDSVASMDIGPVESQHADNMAAVPVEVKEVSGEPVRSEAPEDHVSEGSVDAPSVPGESPQAP